MKHYKLHCDQIQATGFTDLFVLNTVGTTTDFVLNATTAVVLTALAVDDVVWKVLHETKTYLAGPATGTLSVGIVGSLTLFTAASDIKSAAAKTVAAIAAVTPYPNATAVNLVANTVISNTAVTAGEVWIWANISRKNERDIQA